MDGPFFFLSGMLSLILIFITLQAVAEKQAC
jgi:hypothetical protein